MIFSSILESECLMKLGLLIWVVYDDIFMKLILLMLFIDDEYDYETLLVLLLKLSLLFLAC